MARISPQARKVLDELVSDRTKMTAVPAGYRLGEMVTYEEPADRYPWDKPILRTATVWSYGPRDGSMWVIPDHDPTPVVVTVGRGGLKGRLLLAP
jgi:hypothetical protein